MKAALLRQGRMSDEAINMKIVPELVTIEDTEEFYANHLIKAGLRDKDTLKKRAKKAREDLENSIKKTKKSTPMTKAKLADADKENCPGAFGLAPGRRKQNIFKGGYDLLGMTTPVGKVEPI